MGLVTLLIWIFGILIGELINNKGIMMIMKMIKLSFLFIVWSMPIFGDNLFNLPKLLIKIPTRQRPDNFFKVLDMYYAALSGKIPYLFLISCDTDDASMNNAAVISKLNSYEHLFYYFNNNKSKVEAYNADMEKHMDFDLLLVTSDDTKPMQNYDEIIVEIMTKSFPDFDGVLNFNDGHQKQVINTIPVIGKNFYSRFGYIYCSEYKSFYCDEELTLVSQMLKKEVYDPRIIILHMHPDWKLAPSDALYKKNSQFMKIDQKIFKNRKKITFS